jgi:hypothetical protein
MAQALFDEHPLGDYLRGSYIPIRYSGMRIMLLADNGETPLLIPGIHPALEQELVDLNVGLDPNSSGDYKEWLPRVLLDFIQVSFLLLILVPTLHYRWNITFAVTVPFTKIVSNHLVFSFSRLLYPQLTQIIQAPLSRSSSIILSHHPSFLLPCHRHILDGLHLFHSPESSFIAERLA